jgi:ABC-type dipeptide/oligopeptide/nickel transport system ATPase component
VIHQLATCSWVQAGHPLCLIGDSGTGKSHYADLRVMPTWPLNPLQDRVIGLVRSA